MNDCAQFCSFGEFTAMSKLLFIYLNLNFKFFLVLITMRWVAKLS